jgi:hypothetical protein
VNVSEPANAGRAKGTQKPGARHSHKRTTTDDKAAALAVLAVWGVRPSSPKIARLGAFFQGIPAKVAEEKAAEERVQADYRAIWRALERVELKTESGTGIRDCFLRDLKGETLTVAEVRDGKTRAPILKPSEKSKGRPVDVAIGRTSKEFYDLYAWSWKECAAALFLSGADKRNYEAIKKSFRDWDRLNTSMVPTEKQKEEIEAKLEAFMRQRRTEGRR